MATQIILIWEEIPDNTRIYILSEKEVDVEKLLACHGKFIGQVDLWPEHDWLNEWFNEFSEYADPCYRDNEQDKIHLHGDSPDYDFLLIVTGQLL